MYNSVRPIAGISVLGVSLSLLLAGCGGRGSAGSALPSGAQPAAHTAAHAAIASSRARSDVANTTARTAEDVSATYPVTADMPVSRPNETPCVVQLFTNDSFTDFSPRTFSYTPACPGPWAKVVLDADFSVSAGRQFDRTASFWLGPTNIYFGTTAEPSHTVSPQWHIERDVTDLAPIFTSASGGQADIGNIVNGTYTGVIYASAKLEFYPASPTIPAAQSPDAVYALSAGAQGGNAFLYTPSDTLSGTFSFPRNVERAYLDVYLQSQIGDEFWYTCFPNDLAQQLANCGSTAFREGEVTVDGQPAGVAPVYPWIYTGGIDPYLWRPIPGVETLDFVPYRVDLTPFAGVLDDGNQHSVAVSVWNDGNYFAANGALLLYEDRNASQLSGALTQDGTSAAPAQNIGEGVTFDKQGNAKGPINTTAAHTVSLAGYVDTPHGRIVTQVQQSITFKNNQSIDIGGPTWIQNIKQDTMVSSTVTRTFADGSQETAVAHRDWPLTMDYSFVQNPDGTYGQTTSIAQGKVESTSFHPPASGKPFSTSLSNTVTSSDTITFAPDFSSYTPSNGKSKQQYRYNDSSGLCWSKTITSVDYAITGDTGGSC